MKNLFNKIKTPILGFIMKRSVWLHLAAVPFCIIGLNLAKGVLDASYVASKFPVDYMTGQTSFSGMAIKAWYKIMTDFGTLGIYWKTQFLDFGFILSVMALGLVFGTFMARVAIKNGWACKMGMLAAIVIPLGALCDASENLMSFIMLSMPQTFPNWLALPYSAFATVKFGLLTLGMLLLVLSFIFNLSERFIVWFKATKSVVSH